MELKFDPQRKREFVKLILDAGLMEDFINWLRQQGYNYVFGKLDNIPGELVEAYVKSKKLVVEDEDSEIFEEALETPELEPPDKRNVIPAKKKG